jgi:hypothetical protein
MLSDFADSRAIPFDCRIRRQQQQAIYAGLGDQDAVERVAMQVGQVADCEGVLAAHREFTVELRSC